MGLQVFNVDSVDDSVRASLGTTDDMYVAKGVIVAREFTHLWDEFAVRSWGSDHHIMVDGMIVGGSAIELGNSDGDRFNKVTVGTTGAIRSFDESSHAIDITGYSATVNNAGTIWSEGLAIAVDVVSPIGGQTTIINSGTIESTDYAAIARDGDGTQRLVIENSGLIASPLFAFQSSFDAVVDQVRNSGHIKGIVDLRAGDDLYDGRGGSISGSIWGGEGNDRVFGGAGAESINGGQGVDVMQGGGGNDYYGVDNAGDVVVEAANQGVDSIHSSVSLTLSANVENLTMAGAATLGTGNAIANTITGNALQNTLAGLEGNDRLLGETGNDLLTGGLGGDRLTGGAGADRFVFNLITESTAAGTGRDALVDFSRAQGDKIQLTAIDANTTLAGNQAFKFIASQAFTGHAGELRFQAIGSVSYISGDVNGDAKADFGVVSEVVLSFAGSDFFL